ncbi:MAG: TadE/TadG family type IV pilus assembly protein, partial [Bryobacterales bacterium]|nr:TadE/TadG family type IV pilus assembly protein [Bryobacterales bacterium]
MRRHRRKGSAMIEFTLVGIPMIFVLVSIFEMSRAMWVYHTLAYAVKDAVRFAVVHGKSCETAGGQATTVQQIAERVQWAGVGLLPDVLNLSLTTASGTVNCFPLASCLAIAGPPATPGNTARWPPEPGNMRGDTLVATGTYPFRSALSMFWPGAGPGMTFGTFTLRANSRET